MKVLIQNEFEDDFSGLNKDDSCRTQWKDTLKIFHSFYSWKQKLQISGIFKEHILIDSIAETLNYKLDARRRLRK